MFSLHPQLDADTIIIGDLPLSQVLLMNYSQLPWIILVPRRNNASEWHTLEPDDQLQLHRESMMTSSTLMTLFNGDKMNIGALGNLVPQLHLHHIVRFKTDCVWPKPVWGNISPEGYNEKNKSMMIVKLQIAFEQQLSDFVSKQ